MITIYFRTIKHKKLRVLKDFRNGAWINVEDPTSDEIYTLCDTLHVDEEIIRDALDPHEVPRVEVENGITYVFARIPQQNDDIDMSTVPVLIAISETFILTVASQHVVSFDRFVSGAIPCCTTQKMKLFVQFFVAITVVYNRRLTVIARRVRAMNATEKITNRDIVRFVATERVLNDYMSALVPMRRVLRRVLTSGIKRLHLHESDEDLVEDLLVDTEQLEEMCRATLKNIIGIRTAHATILTNNLNHTIRMLAALTIILTIPTIVSSFFGMNVLVPFASSGSSFFFIVGLTFLFIFFILIILRRQRWL